MQTPTAYRGIDILFEDNHLLVVNKPPGMLSQEDKTGDPDLLSLCKEYLKETYQKPGNVFLGLVHRLDRPAGGVMVLARTSKAAGRLSEQVRSRTIRKFYLTVVHGHTPPNGVLVHYLEKDPDTNTVSAVSSDRTGAKRAELSYMLRQYNSENNLSLLRINLLTGRSHQIRVQLSESGRPLYGDRKYSDKSAGEINLALHASELVFNHPITGETMSFSTSPGRNYPWSLFQET